MMTESEMAWLTLDFTLTYGDFSCDVNEQLSASRIGLLGTSGAGKSTMLKVIAGHARPVRGVVRILGLTAFDAAAGVDLPERERGCGFIPQQRRELSLRDDWTVTEQLLSACREQADTSATVDEVLTLTELQSFAKTRVADLPGGYRQMLVVAHVLAARPRVLVVDEPLITLGTPRRSFVPYLVRAADEHGTKVVFSSHNAYELSLAADVVLVMHRGHVVSRLSSKEVCGVVGLTIAETAANIAAMVQAS